MPDIDFDLYSDLYKEINGSRPRSIPSQRAYDAFMSSYEERFEEVQRRLNAGEDRAVAGVNAELGTTYRNIMDLNRAMETERDLDRQNVLLKWLTSY